MKHCAKAHFLRNRATRSNHPPRLLSRRDASKRLTFGREREPVRPLQRPSIRRTTSTSTTPAVASMHVGELHRSALPIPFQPGRAVRQRTARAYLAIQHAPTAQPLRCARRVRPASTRKRANATCGRIARQHGIAPRSVGSALPTLTSVQQSSTFPRAACASVPKSTTMRTTTTPNAIATSPVRA